MKKIITAIIAAAMVMSTATAISASAANTETSASSVTQTAVSGSQERTNLVADWINKWFKTEPEKKEEVKKSDKPWLNNMNIIQLEKYLKKNYKINYEQMCNVVYSVRYWKTLHLTMDQMIYNTRDGIRNCERHNMTPTWNENMIRFMVDFWDQLDSIEIQRVRAYPN